MLRTEAISKTPSAPRGSLACILSSCLPWARACVGVCACGLSREKVALQSHRQHCRRRRMPPGRTLPSLALLPAGSAGTCTLRVVRSMHVWIAISGHSSRTGAGFGCKGRSYWLPSHTSQGAGEVLAPMQPSLVDVRVARPRVVRSGHPRQKMKGSQGGQGRGPWRYAGGNGDRWPGSRLQEPSLRAWH